MCAFCTVLTQMVTQCVCVGCTSWHSPWLLVPLGLTSPLCIDCSLYVCFLDSLDPDGDPMCVLLMIDFYALRSEQFHFLIRMFEEWEVSAFLLVSSLCPCYQPYPPYPTPFPVPLKVSFSGGSLLQNIIISKTSDVPPFSSYAAIFLHHKSCLLPV